MVGGELRIYLSPKASMEGAKSRAHQRGRLEIILNPKASLEVESSEFF